METINHKIPQITEAFNQFKSEHGESYDIISNVIGERGIYLIFAQGYIKCFDKLSEELSILTSTI